MKMLDKKQVTKIMIIILAVVLLLTIGVCVFKKDASNSVVNGTEQTGATEESENLEELKEKNEIEAEALIADALGFYVRYDGEKDAYFSYHTKDGVYQKLQTNAVEKTTLYIVNGRSDVQQVQVMLTDAQGQIVSEQTFSDAERLWKIEFAAESAEMYDVSFSITYNESTEFYVSAAEPFLRAIKDSKVENQSVYQLEDIVIEGAETDTLELYYPFAWYVGEHSFQMNQNLRFQSPIEGAMYIYNASATVFETGQVRCDTPRWSYQMEQIFGNFAEERFYYINAKSVNGKEIDNTTLYVDTEEKLLELLQANTNGKVQESALLVVPEETLRVQIEGDYKLGRVLVDQALTVEFTGKSDARFEGEELHLVWNGKSAPKYDKVQKYMYVKSYNGKEMEKNIGGTANAELVSGSLNLSSKRANAFTIDGNYISISVGYADSILPENAVLKYDLSAEGKAEIVKKGDTYYCVVTDAEARTRSYKINLVEKSGKLPVIHIETKNNKPIVEKEEKIPGKFSIDYNGAESYGNLTDLQMDIKGRGHSSWELAKKPYKLKFEEKISLFGLTEAKEWVLQANHGDKSLIRNKLAMDMGSILDKVLFTPHSYNVDVFVNGEYMGVYTLTEQIEVKDGRIPGEKDSTEVDTDYLLELGGDEEETAFGTNMFHSYLLKYIEIKNPDTDVITQEQYTYIKEYTKAADLAIKNLDGYEAYIDIPSLIDWFILNEFSYNVDGTFRRSDYLMKVQGGKLYMATYWDYDYAFGNFWRDSADFDEWICLGNENTQDYILENWMTYLMTDPNFVIQLQARWEEVGKKLYNTARKTIKEAEKTVSVSAAENFARWPGILGKKIQYEFEKTASIKTYAGQLDYLKKYIEKRYTWMDETIRNMNIEDELHVSEHP